MLQASYRRKPKMEAARRLVDQIVDVRADVNEAAKAKAAHLAELP